MSRRGNCYDNAAMESWNSTLKSELGERIESYGIAKEQLFDYIEVFYNQQRRHSALGYQSPANYERTSKLALLPFRPHFNRPLRPTDVERKVKKRSNRGSQTVHRIGSTPEYLKRLKRQHRRALKAAQTVPLPELPDWTFRDEANVLTAYSFRNGYLEEIHGGFTGFPDDEMKKLMIESSAKLAMLLCLRERDPVAYLKFLERYRKAYCAAWSRDAIDCELGEPPPRRPCPRCSKSVRRHWRFCASCGASLPELESQRSNK